MAKNHTRKTLTNTFIVAIGVLLVVGGYILIGVMSILPQNDNVTRALVMLAVLVILSSIAQLATFSIIASTREGR
ncbi:MAG: hypothetical protein V1836_01360 [Candidatus Aenigmatarchaeota archaeon]